MINLLISGINGSMGQTLLSLSKQHKDINVVAGVDKIISSKSDVKVYTSFESIDTNVDVVVDFSHPSLLDPLLIYCKLNKVAAVLCTTGYTPEQEEKVTKASKFFPVLRSANMSLGVNLIAHLSILASKLLGDAYDIEIIEKHHNRKIDAPSGTALMLANEINKANDDKFNYVFERESVNKSRQNNEIGIHSIRGGTIVGEHEIIFAGIDEIISIKHSISSRTVFAVGAIKAVKFLSSKPSGLYGMSDIID